MEIYFKKAAELLTLSLRHYCVIFLIIKSNHLIRDILSLLSEKKHSYMHESFFIQILEFTKTESHQFDQTEGSYQRKQPTILCL